MTPADGGAAELPARFIEKFEVLPNGCWAWKARLDACGYGRVFFNGRNAKAHRVMYTMLVGHIPSGLVLDHSCRNRHCVNPQHLRVVTNQVNTMQNSNSLSAVNAKKTHCPRGHEYSAANTYYRRNPVSRICKACHIKKNVAYTRKRRALLREIRAGEAN